MEGKDPEEEIRKAQKEEAAKEITLKDVFPMFMERHGVFQSKKMQESYMWSFKNISRCPSLINVRIDTITKKLVLDYMYERMKVDKVKSATVNKEAAFLKCLFSKLAEWEMLERNLLQGMKLFPEGGKRDVFLTEQQAISLIQELPKSVANIVEFAIYTGFRKRISSVFVLKIFDSMT